jgi:hypothetical protein
VPSLNHHAPLTPDERRRFAALLATGLVHLGSTLRAATFPRQKPRNASRNLSRIDLLSRAGGASL